MDPTFVSESPPKKVSLNTSGAYPLVFGADDDNNMSSSSVATAQFLNTSDLHDSSNDLVDALFAAQQQQQQQQNNATVMDNDTNKMVTLSSDIALEDHLFSSSHKEKEDEEQQINQQQDFVIESNNFSIEHNASSDSLAEEYDGVLRSVSNSELQPSNSNEELLFRPIQEEDHHQESSVQLSEIVSPGGEQQQPAPVASPRMKKHSSFEEEERFDLDEVLASCTTEGVTRSDAFVESLRDVVDFPEDVDRLVEVERSVLLKEGSLHLIQPQTVTPPPNTRKLSDADNNNLPHPPITTTSLIEGLTLRGEEEQEGGDALAQSKSSFNNNNNSNTRPETDNTSVFDLEAVLAADDGEEEIIQDKLVYQQQQQEEPSLNLIDFTSPSPHSSAAQALHSVSFDLTKVSPEQGERLNEEESSSEEDDEIIHTSQVRESNLDFHTVNIISNEEYLANEPPQELLNGDNLLSLVENDPNNQTKDPTPPTTRHNSLFQEDPQEQQDTLQRELEQAAYIANSLNNNQELLFPDQATGGGVVVERTQTDDLNRALLMSAAASTIPSQFFQANNRPMEDDDDYKEEEEEEEEFDYEKRQAEVDNEQEETVANTLSTQSEASPPVEEDSFVPPKLLRQLTSESDYEIDSSSPSPTRSKAVVVESEDALLDIPSANQTSKVADDDDMNDFQKTTTAVDDFDEDFGDFEEAQEFSPKLEPPQPQQQPLLPTVLVEEPALPMNFFSTIEEEEDLQTFFPNSTGLCSKCSLPTNFEVFSVCVACWDNPNNKSSNSSSSRLLSRNSSTANESILNDLLNAVEFDLCLEDPSALPLAALAASDNDGALRLLLGDDFVDSKTVSGKMKPLEGVLKKKPTALEEDKSSFFVV